MSLHTKTQLLEMIYRKSLRVSGAVKAALGVGPIVNLQSNDAAKLWTLPTYLHMVWNGPFQVRNNEIFVEVSPPNVLLVGF
jgi:ATP-binding cassette subfamily C (CFTR/MRP) protein 1